MATVVCRTVGERVFIARKGVDFGTDFAGGF